MSLERKGFTLWFTGLPCSGKTTLSRAVKAGLVSAGRRVVRLDGDRVRKNLCRDLGFSKKDRDASAARVARLASSLTRGGFATLVSLISPYRRTREAARRLIGPFIEIYVRCPLSVCEKRDVKGQYRLARLGKIKNFTGISDPYEEPERPEIIVDTDRTNVEGCVRKILGSPAVRNALAVNARTQARLSSLRPGALQNSLWPRGARPDRSNRRVPNSKDKRRTSRIKGF